MAGKKKVMECHSGFRPSEKELLEWHSVAKIALVIVKKIRVVLVTEGLNGKTYQIIGNRGVFCWI
jgi:hypothetical protein